MSVSRTLRTVVILFCLLAVSPFSVADTRRYVAVAPAPSGRPELVTNATAVESTGTVTSLQIINFDMGACTPTCYLVVAVYIRASTTDHTCTFGATAIDQNVRYERQNNAGVYFAGVEGVSGIATITCTWTTAREAAIHARSFKNVDQTTPTDGTILFDKDGTATSTLISFVGTPTNSLVVDAIFKNGQTETATPGAGQTQDVYGSHNANAFDYAASKKDGGGNVDISWTWVTSNNVSNMAMVLNPAP